MPDVDIPQFWKHILFSCLVGNTDDHMRNHGFLWDGVGWRPSPAFDVNPTPGNGPKYLRNAIDLDDASVSTALALRTSEYYRVSPSSASSILTQMRGELARWRSVARSCGISAASMDRMASCLDSAAVRG